MAFSPIPHVIVMVGALVFQGVFYGEEIAEESFPEYEQPNTEGFWGAVEALTAVVNTVWGAVVFLFNLITFNIPGSPWWSRVVVSTYFGGTIFWSIATLIRGN